MSQRAAIPSTRNLAALPTPRDLERTLQSAALVDAIMCERYYLRTHHFDSQWWDGITMAKYDNGSGDHYYVTFTKHGVFVKGFDHESPMSPHAADEFGTWPGVLDSVPAEFHEFVHEPAFQMEDITFCLWCLEASDGTEAIWGVGTIEFPGGVDLPDGSSWMLASFVYIAETYREWAEDYFEVSLPVEPIERIFRHEPLTLALAQSINPDANWDQVLKDAQEIGYPCEA